MSHPAADDGRWEARIARARLLSVEHPAASEILNFYAELVGFEQRLIGDGLAASGAACPPPLGDAVGRIVSAIPGFLSFLSRVAPPRLAGAAGEMSEVDPVEWHSLLDRYWGADAHDVPDADEGMLFVVEALLQPFAEALVLTSGGAAMSAEPAGAPRRVARCPACTGKPGVGLLREDGQSARRSLVCGLCLTEWRWPRVVCPACGEDTFEALPAYRSEAFASVRVDACDSCRTYMKTIDLSHDALAIPTVDELACVPLDLWAREQGYTKLRPNLLRM
jgi:FdhE protein